MTAIRKAEALGSREAWLRRRKIGASDVAKILGVSPYGSVWDVWTRLVGQAASEKQNSDMARGHRWEPIVLDLYQAETGNQVKRPKAHTLWEGPERWASATPDGFVVDGWGLVEAKTDRHADKWGDPAVIERWSDGCERIVRSDYALQCYAQMHVIDRPFVDLAVLLPFYELRVYRIHRDLEVEAAIVEALEAWYTRHVDGREPPDVDGSYPCRAWLAQRFPATPRSTMRAARPAERVIAAELAEVQAAQKHLKGEYDRLQAELLNSIAHEKAIDLGTGGHATVVRMNGKRELDEKRLRSDRPDLAPLLDQYTRTGAPSAHVRLYGAKE